MIEHYDRQAMRRQRHNAEEVSLEEAGREMLHMTRRKTGSLIGNGRSPCWKRRCGGCGVDYELARGAAAFEVIKQFLPSAQMGIPDYERAAAALRMTVPTLRVEVHRIRKQSRELLRREVARTVLVPHEIDEELQHIKDVLLHG